MLVPFLRGPSPRRRGPLASPSVSEGRQRQAPLQKRGQRGSARTRGENFIQRQGRSERLVAEVEIVFGENAGVLSGMKLVGLCIWKSDKGQLFVTLLRQWEAAQAAGTSAA